MSYKSNPNCIVCAYGDGIAVLNQHTSDYFSLDPVGAAIWEVFERATGGATLDDAVKAVTEKFDVTPQVCRPDVASFLGTLEAANLIEQTP